MSNRTETARGRRSEARERRRSRLSQPFEELDEAAESASPDTSSGSNGELTGAAAKVVGTAVAAGVLGALGAAAKALLERRDSGSRQEPGQVSHPEHDKPEESPQPQQKAEEPGPEATQPQADEPEPDARRVPDGDPGEVASTARSRLESLLGTDVERVSGLDRSNGRWTVSLEVVEVHRVPESTDVMATYEVVLDGDGDLVSVNRTRRYRRSQVDEQR